MAEKQWSVQVDWGNVPSEREIDTMLDYLNEHRPDTLPALGILENGLMSARLMIATHEGWDAEAALSSARRALQRAQGVRDLSIRRVEVMPWAEFLEREEAFADGAMIST
ncbi:MULTISPECIES: hypothetical protein [Streptosporangium]|uniref:Uncharacterized protein n=1 Tax=Streptosporangium brasiliense TaxID=47480 RepID=A0ABT9RM69_9ACTN|nr:hypothetical protein [Streptosporangium brasiliense]MDP9870391.1 hypothetical protein [Streptosporangium brasiliense]